MTCQDYCRLSVYASFIFNTLDGRLILLIESSQVDSHIGGLSIPNNNMMVEV